MDSHSLERLEFSRVAAAVAACAECVRARALLTGWGPIADPAARGLECARLAEALRRSREPGDWVWVGEGSLEARIESAEAGGQGWDGPGLVEVERWLNALASTRAAWTDAALLERFPRLADVVGRLPDLEALRKRLNQALDPDGRIKDSASPALARARRDLGEGERKLEHSLERWASGFGEQAYVTRHGDRFVALVPAAGFSRRRGIVHDVSGSGQSLFVEPLEACESNNRLLEVRAAVTEEERRILRELVDRVLEHRDALIASEECLAHLDTLRARARFGIAFDGVAITPAGDRLALRQGRHPVLAMAAAENPGRPVVPLDLELAAGARLLLVSGPNMGGKTVLMKTVGLAAVMSHAAFPVLALEGSAVPEIDVVIADLGDEQSVEQGLSTFAAHLRELGRMAEHAGPRSLLLCDELGAGTDPEEGAALGRALIEHFAARGAWGVITTHLGSLKRVATEVAGVVNGSLEFDIATLTSRFRFLPGVPGASHALSVAERLGFDTTLVARARALTPDETRALERLIADLEAALTRARSESESAAHARADAESQAAEYRRTIEVARQESAELRRRLTRESEALLARARELWQEVQREARKGEKRREGAERLREEIRAVETAQEQLAHDASATHQAHVAPAALAAGQRVRVVDLGVEAEVVSGPDPEGRVRLKRGSWNIQSHASKLALVEGKGVEAPERRALAGTWSSGEDAPPLEVDLRGMEVEEALRTVDTGLDRAVLAGLTEIRIVHGIGRGVLRAAVERHLRGHPQVAEQRMGVVGEGGRGVTVVRLR